VFSAWGKAWDCAWGDSWGPCKVGGGGPGGSATKAKPKRNKQGEGWANERARLEASILARKAEKEKALAKPEIAPKVVDTTAVEEDLKAQALAISRNITLLEERLHREEITLAEFETAKRRENEALDVILMAINLDNYIVASIILH